MIVIVNTADCIVSGPDLVTLDLFNNNKIIKGQPDTAVGCNLQQLAELLSGTVRTKQSCCSSDENCHLCAMSYDRTIRVFQRECVITTTNNNILTNNAYLAHDMK